MLLQQEVNSTCLDPKRGQRRYQSTVLALKLYMCWLPYLCRKPTRYSATIDQTLFKLESSLMKIQSLAFRTDLHFIAFQGRVEQKGGYIVAETPDNPGFFWGNLLLMPAPPKIGDMPKWIALFQQEFAHQPLIKHITFGWDAPDGAQGTMDEFIQNGFDAELSMVLTLGHGELVPPKYPRSDIVVRVLESDSDWRRATENQITSRDQKLFSLESYTPFKQKQMAKYRAMTDAGHGHWYGAFLGTEMVADCGVFVFGTTARFQAVGTLPQHRGGGICGNLIYQATQHTLANKTIENKTVEKIVMVADPNYHAARIYTSVGFKPTEKQIGVYRWPKQEWVPIP